MRLATLDLETDPFEHGKVPRPFVSGFYDGEEFTSIWSPDCVARSVAAIQNSSKGPFLIYAHNGGKFDFHYYLRYFDGNLRIVNNRIISAWIGKSEVRDSYAIMPFPLREYRKDDIDYNKLNISVREQHRREIVDYLRTDCVALHELVSAFHAEFGDQLTIGGSSLKQLKKRHPFQCGGEVFDTKFRKDFYFGGRVQVFKPGIVNMPMSIYDVNSMYPYVMRSALHPVGTSVMVDKKIRPNTCFVVAEGKNDGGLCVRSDDGSLSFEKPEGRFCTTIHEWQAAEETGTFRTTRVVKTYGCDSRVTFDEFVSHFYGERKRAKFTGDQIRTLFYKFVLNSAYGKFAQNPENFADYQITSRGELLPDGCAGDCGDSPETPCPHWHVAYFATDYLIWSRRAEVKRYYNVCTGASITGAARAILLRGLHAADTPLYCDTDSIICRSLRLDNLDSNELGSWKLEAMGNRAAFCGKKLYAIIDTESLYPCSCKEGKQKECTVHVKKAHKGANLTYEEIFRIAKGQCKCVKTEDACDFCVRNKSAVPAFRLNGEHTFVTRRIRRTV